MSHHTRPRHISRLAGYAEELAQVGTWFCRSCNTWTFSKIVDALHSRLNDIAFELLDVPAPIFQERDRADRSREHLSAQHFSTPAPVFQEYNEADRGRKSLPAQYFSKFQRSVEDLEEALSTDSVEDLNKRVVNLRGQLGEASDTGCCPCSGGKIRGVSAIRVKMRLCVHL
mmetsp:Transcript_32395/g.64192  ORF Transcript_32395/g.64192 Transcript_32395/m.64192 type:complete len:171 (-) Transcript_32395:165-677(-)